MVAPGQEERSDERRRRRRRRRRREKDAASVTPQPAEFSQVQGDAKGKFTKQLLFGWPGSLESLEEAEPRFIVPPPHCVSLHKVKRAFNATVSLPQAFY